MRGLKTTIAGMAVAGLTVIAPVVAKAETLKDALRSAYQHSGLLNQNRALLRAADEDVGQALAQLRPVVNWSASYRDTFSSRSVTTVGVNVDWLLYDFGRTALGVEVQKENVLSIRSRLIEIEQQVLLRAANAYMSYRETVEIESLRASNVQLIQKELRAARDRFDVGEITRTDVSLAEARLASAKSALAAAKGLRARAVAEFINVIGRKPKSPRAPKRLARIPSSMNKAIQTARRHHPSLQEVQHAISAAELQVKQAELAMKPSLRAQAGISTDTANGNGVTRSVGLTVSGPIYQGGQLTSLKRQAMARRDAQRGALHVVRHNVEQGVRNAYADLQVARASKAASNQQIKAANIAFQGVREEATLGARTTLDVLNAEQELLDARNARVSAMIDEHLAAYAILAATGQMTAEKLKLGVKTYDPSEYYNLVKTAPVKRSKQGAALDRVLNRIANGN